jgi:hypothetical protein
LQISLPLRNPDLLWTLESLSAFLRELRAAALMAYGIPLFGAEGREIEASPDQDTCKLDSEHFAGNLLRQHFFLSEPQT